MTAIFGDTSFRLLGTMSRIFPVCCVGALVMAMATLRASAAQDSLRVGERMPELKGQTPTGRTAVLPQAAAGKVTLVAMGFTYKSRSPVGASADWLQGAIVWFVAFPLDAAVQAARPAALTAFDGFRGSCLRSCTPVFFPWFPRAHGDPCGIPN